MSTNLQPLPDAPGFSPAELRYAMSAFATGVTVVTARDGNGVPVGLTANSFASVSLDPPLVLWSIGLGTPSFAAFRDYPHYAINVLSADQEHISNRFANPSPDKFAGIDYTLGLSDVPLLSGCIATFECSHEAQYEGGDHLILLGRIERYRVEMAAPLLYFASRYAGLQP